VRRSVTIAIAYNSNALGSKRLSCSTTRPEENRKTYSTIRPRAVHHRASAEDRIVRARRTAGASRSPVPLGHHGDRGALRRQDAQPALRTAPRIQHPGAGNRWVALRGRVLFAVCVCFRALRRGYDAAVVRPGSSVSHSARRRPPWSTWPP